MRYFVFLLLAAFNMSAFAATCKYYIMADGVTTTTSASAACESELPFWRKSYGANLSVEFTGTSGSPPSGCNFKVTGSNGRVYAEPSSSLQYTTKQCEDTVCKSRQGQETVVNFTVGYTRTPDIDADPNWKLVGPPNKIPSSGLLCNPASPCELKYSGGALGVWQSAAPTPNGLYRLSLDIPASYTGATCTASEVDNAALSKTAPIPPCPGFTGEVNGVPGCYGTASNPTSNDKPEPKPKTPEAGNPPAGEKPSTGEGSGSGGQGRTPSTGDGGPGGGPAAAAGSGKAPDGTTPKPEEGKEQAACGAPGQPKCSINEAGTPDGKNAFDSSNAGLEEGKKGWIAEIEKVKDLTAPGWTWTFQLPSGCTALSVPAFNLTLDVCQFQPIIHDIMSMLWAIATVMGCALMVFNATGKN